MKKKLTKSRKTLLLIAKSNKRERNNNINSVIRERKQRMENRDEDSEKPKKVGIMRNFLLGIQNIMYK